MPVAVLDRLVLQPARDGCLAIFLIVSRGHQVVMPRHGLPTFGVHRSLRRGDFTVHAGPSIFAARVVVPQGVAPGATRTQVNFADGHRKTAWTPPALDVLWLGRGLPDQTARRIDHRGDDEFTVRRRAQRDDGLTLYGHFFPPCLSAPADTHPVCQYALPSSRDSVPPSRRRLSAEPPRSGTVATAPVAPASPVRRGGGL